MCLEHFEYGNNTQAYVISGTVVYFTHSVDGVDVGCEQNREVKNISGFWCNGKEKGEE